MAFFRHLGKKKVKFNYQIRVQGVEKLDGTKWKNGEPLYCQCKRASKTLRTTNAVLEKGSVVWNEIFAFKATLYKDESNKFDKKPFLFSVQNEGKQVGQKFYIEIDLSEIAKEQGINEKALHLTLTTNVPECTPILRLAVRVWDSVGATPPETWTNNDYERKSISISTSFSTSATNVSVVSTPRIPLARGISETQVTQVTQTDGGIKEGEGRSEEQQNNNGKHERDSHSSDESRDDDRQDQKEKVQQRSPLTPGDEEKHQGGSPKSNSTPRERQGSNFPTSQTTVGPEHHLQVRTTSPNPESPTTRSSVARSSTWSPATPKESNNNTDSNNKYLGSPQHHARMLSELGNSPGNSHSDMDNSDDDDERSASTPIGGRPKKRGFSRFRIVPPGGSGGSTNGTSGTPGEGSGGGSVSDTTSPGTKMKRKDLFGAELDNLVANFNRPEMSRPLSGPSDFDRDPEGETS